MILNFILFLVVLLGQDLLSKTQLDFRFGPERTGIVKTILGNDAQVSSCLVDSNKKIIIVGHATYDNSDDLDLKKNLILIRFNQGGSLDSKFGNHGVVKTYVGQSIESACAILVKGKILVAAKAKINNSYDLVLVQYDSNGSLDTSFGANGISITNMNSQINPTAIAIDDNRKILITGSFVNYINKNIFVVRLNKNGRIDHTFANGGIANTQIGVNSQANSIQINPNGVIFISGNTTNYLGQSFLIVSYNEDGTLNSNFGMNGKIILGFGSQQSSANSILLSKNSIFAGGFLFDQNNNKVSFLTNLDKHGNTNSRFGENGLVVNNFDNFSEIDKIIFDKKSRIIAGINISNEKYALIRLDQNGKLDTNFGDNGSISNQFGTNNKAFFSFQGDKKIIIAGSFNNQFIIARYNVETK